LPGATAADDGSAVQENVVRLNGQRGSFVSILRAGGASTVDVVKNVRNLLPYIKSTLPEGLEIKPLFDQSLFVMAAAHGVIREATIAAALTGLMIAVSWQLAKYLNCFSLLSRCPFLLP
jgi:multidrug efflux pump subunit AcrB